jgi:hypothetical protein
MPGKVPEMRDFPQKSLSVLKIGNAWLGREDSNLHMAESKSATLPLGKAPIAYGARRSFGFSGRVLIGSFAESSRVFANKC